MLFSLVHNSGELGGLNLSLTEALSLEEWEADGLLRRLGYVQAKIAAAKAGEKGVGGIEEEDPFKTDSDLEE